MLSERRSESQSNAAAQASNSWMSNGPGPNYADIVLSALWKLYTSTVIWSAGLGWCKNDLRTSPPKHFSLIEMEKSRKYLKENTTVMLRIRLYPQ